MPPLRTYSSVKPIKTERTHEENQERAYIAASRRSDRSLEARVESARRASEIHKRRTGRSLKVTEQDVINEEMYEEEDDDLPLQYRRLTAHLQTGSADFNRRLAAYLTNHVAMRSALDQAISDSYAQQYPNAPNFSHNQYSAFPSPIVTQGLPAVPPGSVPQSAPPRTTNHPHPYRQTPYPMPGAPGYRQQVQPQQQQQQQHKRSASMVSPYPTPGVSPNYINSTVEAPSKPQFENRRMSMPAASASTPTTPIGIPPNEVGISSSKSSPLGKVASPVDNDGQELRSMGPPSSQPRPVSAQKQRISPLTMSLPQDSRMLLGPSLNTDEHFASMLMSGNPNPAAGYFDSNSFNSGKNVSYYPALAGMNSTLAPSALNMSPSVQTPDGQTHNPFGGNAGLNHDLNLQLGDLKGVQFPITNTSALNTPAADTSWDAFINDQSWTENNT